MKTQKKREPPLKLTSNTTFRAFFREKETLLISILQDFLPLPDGYKIESIRILDGEEPPERIRPEGKTYRLDLKVKLIRGKEGGGPQGLKKEETCNVEVQTTSHDRFTERLLAYAGRLYSSQLGKGEAYSKLKKVYSLVFCTQNLTEFQELPKEYYHACDIRRIQPPHLRMTDGIQFIVVELKKFEKRPKELKDQREAWAWLLRNSEQLDQDNNESEIKTKGDIMRQAVEHLWRLSGDELLREQLEVEEKDRQDREAALKTYFKEGKKEGREEGKKEGREEGREEGMEKGKKAVALELLKDGQNFSYICKITGLSEKEVKGLKSSSQKRIE